MAPPHCATVWPAARTGDTRLHEVRLRIDHPEIQTSPDEGGGHTEGGVDVGARHGQEDGGEGGHGQPRHQATVHLYQEVLGIRMRLVGF